MTKPELPEFENTRRGLAQAFEGSRLVRVEARVPRLRFDIPAGFAEKLTGRTVTRLDRRAKFMLVHTDDGQVMIVHLGMSGRMRVFADAAAAGPPEKHDHLEFETDAGLLVRFNDARRFGFVDLAEAAGLGHHPMLRDLGPEPLGNEFSGPVLAAALAGRHSPIKAALLDQKTVAGLGNIYVCEALFRAGISPRRSAHTVQGARAERLAAAIRAVLDEAIAAGGSSLRDFRHADGELGYFQKQFSVYGREGERCPAALPGEPACAVRRIVQSGRSTFYCSRHQR
ncbi:MAG: bifunctional DNA-formamidopyrimidine glycosylase/DNA-(apurinic or apyrimidinic site) lyase [Alphaproteobacteria bacterium]